MLWIKILVFERFLNFSLFVVKDIWYERNEVLHKFQGVNILLTITVVWSFREKWGDILFDHLYYTRKFIPH